MKVAAKDARTAELSPDGSMVGYERNGNMFIYDFASKKETQLTNAQRLMLHFGLARVLDARGEYAEAAEHLAVLVQQVLQGASPGATTVIKAAIRPYSIAIAPASSLKRR